MWCICIYIYDYINDVLFIVTVIYLDLYLCIYIYVNEVNECMHNYTEKHAIVMILCKSLLRA